MVASMTDTAAALPMVPRPFIVDRFVEETHDTFTLELVPGDRGPGIEFLPGQFTMLYLPGIGEVPISISGDASEPGRLVHTIRRVGSVTRALESVGLGGLVGVRGPFGSSWPLSDAQGGDLLIIAGGIGLAPLRPSIYHALANRDAYNDFTILYGARSPEDLLYIDEIQMWRGRFDTGVGVTVDRAAQSWRGDVGVVTNLIRWARFEPETVHAMVCGPEIMMRFVAAELRKRGVSAERIHVSLERNMKCGIGLCGHCQIGPVFACKDGPVVDYQRAHRLLATKEV